MFDIVMIFGMSIWAIGFLGILAAAVVFGVLYWLYDEEVEWSLMAKLHLSQGLIKRCYFGITSTCAFLVALTIGFHNTKSDLESTVSECVWEDRSCSLEKRLYTRLGGEIPNYRGLSRGL